MASMEILPGLKFGSTFAFVDESDPNAWNAPNLASISEAGLAEFNDSFMHDVAAKMELGLSFVDKEGSDIWNMTPSEPSSPSMKKKKKPVVEEKAVIEEELSKQNLYKTELCRSFVETGICRYGHKCQFAHGSHEIRSIMRHPKYKTEVCKKYASTGHCPYGVRCRFIHPLLSAHTTPVASEPLPQASIAPPPVVWSNSWGTPAAPEEKKSLKMKKMPPSPIGTPLGGRLAFFQSIA